MASLVKRSCGMLPELCVLLVVLFCCSVFFMSVYLHMCPYRSGQMILEILQKEDKFHCPGIPCNFFIFPFFWKYITFKGNYLIKLKYVWEFFVLNTLVLDLIQTMWGWMWEDWVFFTNAEPSLTTLLLGTRWNLKFHTFFFHFLYFSPSLSFSSFYAFFSLPSHKYWVEYSFIIIYFIII